MGFFCGVLGARCWVVRERPCGGFLVCGRVAAGLVGLVVVRLCLFVENFIVDASIFVVVIVLCAPAGLAWSGGCVLCGKLLSAIGGCLGTKSR